MLSFLLSIFGCTTIYIFDDVFTCIGNVGITLFCHWYVNAETLYTQVNNGQGTNCRSKLPLNLRSTQQLSHLYKETDNLIMIRGDDIHCAQ